MEQTQSSEIQAEADLIDGWKNEGTHDKGNWWQSWVDLPSATPLLSDQTHRRIDQIFLGILLAKFGFLGRTRGKGKGEMVHARWSCIVAGSAVPWYTSPLSLDVTCPSISFDNLKWDHSSIYSSELELQRPLISLGDKLKDRVTIQKSI
jgi:hypothetical protein